MIEIHTLHGVQLFQAKLETPKSFGESFNKSSNYKLQKV
jgi:hypothetical protein